MPKRPTSADVANLAGVSRTTVSFVLNDDRTSRSPTRRVRAFSMPPASSAITPMRPPVSWQAERSRVVALVMLQSAEQVAGDALLADTLRGLASAARYEGFRVMRRATRP